MYLLTDRTLSIMSRFVDVETLLEKDIALGSTVWIDRLGLVPDNRGDKSGPRTFHDHRVVSAFVRAVRDVIIHLKEGYQNKQQKLEHELACPEFRDGLTKHLLQDHGMRVWGATRGHLRGVLTDDYPSDLFYDNEEDKEMYVTQQRCK